MISRGYSSDCLQGTVLLHRGPAGVSLCACVSVRAGMSHVFVCVCVCVWLGRCCGVYKLSHQVNSIACHRHPNPVPKRKKIPAHVHPCNHRPTKQRMNAHGKVVTRYFVSLRTPTVLRSVSLVLATIIRMQLVKHERINSIDCEPTYSDEQMNFRNSSSRGRYEISTSISYVLSLSIHPSRSIDLSLDCIFYPICLSFLHLLS